MANVTVQVIKAMLGYGAAGDVLTINETTQVDYLISVGALALYSGPSSPGSAPKPNGFASRNAGQAVPIASRGNHYYGGLFGSSSTQTFISKHYLFADCLDVEVDYGNWYGTSGGAQGDGATDLTVSFSVMTLGGSITRGYFGQTRQGIVKPGGLLTGKAPFVGAKGSYFYILTYVSGNWPTGLTINYARGNGQDTVGDGNNTDSGEGIASPTGTDVTTTGTKSASQQLCYSPFMIRGTTRTANVPCMLVEGDSIITYSNEAPDMGWAVRAIANGYPYVKVCQPGETAQQWAANGTAMSLIEGRMGALKFGTHAIYAYGRNDVSGGRTLAQLQGDWITGWGRQGLSIVGFQATITPRPTSTDNWITLGNQTVDVNEAVRLTANAWLRDGAPMIGTAPQAVGTTGSTVSRCNVYNALSTLIVAASGPPHLLQGGILEVTDLVESARDSGKFAVNRIRTVGDGSVVTGTSVKILNSATANFQATEVGYGLNVAGAGSAGAINLSTISGYISATQVNTAKSFSTSVSGAAVTIGAATYDGTHPNGDRHRDIGSAVKPILDAAIAAYTG